MKTIPIGKTILGFLFSFSMIACQKIPVDQVILRYEIHNPDYKTIDFSYHFLAGQVQKAIEIKRDTVFIDTLKINEPLYLSVSTHDRFWIYAEPGKSITITLDTGAFLTDQVTFSGQLRNQNNYLKEVENLHRQVKWEGGFGSERKAEAFKALLDSVNEVKHQILNRYQKTTKVPSFWSDQLEYIDIQSMTRCSSYVLFYYMNFQETIPEEWRTKLSPDFSKYLDRPDLLKLPYLQYSMDDFIRRKTANLSNKWWYANKARKDDEGFVRPHMDEFGMHYVIDSIKNEKTRNFLMRILAEDGFYRGELAPISNVLSLFYRNCTDSSMINSIRESEKALKRIQPGEIAPEIYGFSPDGSELKLSDFRGKFVFIDVWATWCGPCIGEFPTFRKLVEAYRDRNITFIMYSINENREDWKKYLAENEMVGVQIIGDKGFGNKFMDIYKFTGIPRHLLFDPEGRIVKTGLDSPSSLLHYKTLDSYLSVSQ